MFHTKQDFIAHAKQENLQFFKNMNNKVVVEYIRDVPPENHTKGTPNAVMVAFIAGDEVTFGWSAVNGETFSKPIGLWKAIRRAMGEARPGVLLPTRIQNNYLGFLNRAKGELYKKATAEVSR